METIQLTGRYRIEKDLKVKDPLITITHISYDFVAMMATVTITAENTQYAHSRVLDPEPFTKELTTAQIKNMVQLAFAKKSAE